MYAAGLFAGDASIGRYDAHVVADGLTGAPGRLADRAVPRLLACDLSAVGMAADAVLDRGRRPRSTTYLTILYTTTVRSQSLGLKMN